jgi:hypothetical protein
MITKAITVYSSAASLYDLMKDRLPADEVAAVDNFNQKLFYNVIIQVTFGNTGEVYVGNASYQDLPFTSSLAEGFMDKWEFNKQSITDFYIRGTDGDTLGVALVPNSN